MTNASHIGRPLLKPGSWKAYLAAVSIAAIVTVLQLALGAWAASVPYVVPFLAVILATLLCGSAGGLLVAALSVASAWLFVLPELSDFAVSRTMLFAVGSVSVVTVSCILRRTTVRVWRLNEVLRLSEAKFRGLLESAPDAMVILDEEGRIALVNARTEALFGYPRTALLGKPVAMLLAERTQASYMAKLEAIVAGRSAAPGGMDLYGRCKDGREFPIEVSFGRLSDEAGTLVSSAIRDITARRQIEVRLEEASKAKSEFLAHVSHELRTPLNAIIGFSEVMRDAIIGPLDARYREYSGDINRAGRHLLNLINGILDISKIEAGRLQLRDEIVSITESIEACRRIIAVMAEANGVSLSIDLARALPPIRCDELRFRQVLLNVMSNAVKFTPAGGGVRVSAALEKEGLAILVEDTGMGMKPEEIAVALEPFRQLDATLNRRFQGTGLGLPLAKALVELHGGRLDIQSAPGAGTTVRIRLPQERAAHAAA